MNRVTFYTKPGCGLCDEAKEVIDQAREQIEFVLEQRNILDDVALYERFKHEIPVVFLNGSEIARHRLSLTQLRAALRTAAG